MLYACRPGENNANPFGLVGRFTLLPGTSGMNRTTNPAPPPGLVQSPAHQRRLYPQHREAVASFPAAIALPVATALFGLRQSLSAECEPPMDFVQPQPLAQHRQAGLMIVLAL